MTHHTGTRSTTLALLFALPVSLTAACVGEIEPTPPGTQGPGGKSDYDGEGDPDGGTSTNPVPPSASATATVDCAGGHATTFSPDWEALSVIFDGNALEPGRPIDCTVTLDYRFDAGWTFDLPHVDARGFRFLEEGARVDLRLGATVGGAGSSVADAWAGELSDDFFLRFDGGGASPSCGVTSARVVVRATATAGGTGATYAVIDSIDSELDWRRCN